MQKKNNWVDFAARMFEQTSQAETHSIEQQLVYVEVVAKIGLQHIDRFVLLWVRNVIIVVCSIILQRYVGKKIEEFKKISTRYSHY